MGATCLSGERAQGLQEKLIFFRRAHGYPQTAGKQHMALIEILDQYPLFKQAGENRSGRSRFYPKQEKIRPARPWPHTGNGLNGKKQLLPVRAQARRLGM